MLRRYFTTTLLVAFSVSFLVVAESTEALAASLPDCVRGAKIERVQPVRIGSRGELIQRNGTALVLEGLRLPMSDSAPVPLTAKVTAALRGRIGQRLLAASFAPRTDRYGRVRAQLFDSDGYWLQVALLREGLARVSIAPDRTECAGELFAAEADARRQERGLWQLPQYRIRATYELRNDIGSFQIVEGTVRDTYIRDGEGKIVFDDGSFATIGAEDMRSFHETGVDPRSYAGQTLRIRGLVLPGSSIAIANPQSVEVVQ